MQSALYNSPTVLYYYWTLFFKGYNFTNRPRYKFVEMKVITDQSFNKIYFVVFTQNTQNLHLLKTLLTVSYMYTQWTCG